MGHRRRSWVVSGVVLVAAACGTSDPAVFEPGPHLLADMVASRIMAGDIPDHGLALDGDSLYVVQLGDVDTEWGALRSDLFGVESTRIVVATLDSLRGLSRSREGASVTYLAVGIPIPVSENRWRLSLGGDYVVAEPEEMRLCCCTGDALFELGPDRLEFVEWTMVICS